MKRFSLRTLGLCGALGLITSLASAEIPRIITYQGLLRDALGAPVPDAAYLVKFQIWDASAAGTSLWNSGFQAINTVDGLFDYNLGSNVVLPPSVFVNDTTRYLGITVGADPEMTPRIKLASHPYVYQALESNAADNADNLGGKTPGFYNAWGNLTGVPGGFADNVDNNTTYSAGSGLQLSGTTFLIPTAGVTATHLATNSVQAAEIAANAVGASEIAAGAVGASEIATGAVAGGTGGDILDASIIADDLASNSVGASEIQTGAVGAAEIATGAVGSAEVATNSLTSSDLAAGSVGSSELATSSVIGGTGGDIADGTITAADLATNSVAAAEIAAGAVGQSEIATSGVGSLEIASNAITSSKVANGSLFDFDLGDEPGVAQETNSFSTTITSSTVAKIDSQTITCPSSGYVLAIASVELSFAHVSGNTSRYTFWVSNTTGIPSGQQKNIERSSSLPSGLVSMIASTQHIFSVNAGAFEVYTLADKSTGDPNYTIDDRTLSLVFFPTAYGPMTSALIPPGADESLIPDSDRE